MSFLDITNPHERDKIVSDYLQTRKRIQQRNEDEKTIGLARKEELETIFNPIIEGQRETTESINQLKPKEIKIVKKRTWNDRQSVQKSRKVLWYSRG